MKIINMKLYFIISFFILLLPVVSLSSEENKSNKSHHEDTLIHYLTDHNYIELPGLKFKLPEFKPIYFKGIGLNFSITENFVFLWIGIIVLIIILLKFNTKKLVQTSLIGQIIESLVIFIRDDIVRPSLPDGFERYMPFFLTVFMCILMENVLGLIPFMSSSTKNISVTSALAFITFIMMIHAGLKKHGLVGYIKTMLPISGQEMNKAAAVVFNIVLFPIEIIGLCTKPFALSIRLFANMIAGHAVILSLLLIGWGGSELGWNYFTSVPSVLGAVFIYLLECLVVFLQAYVFTLLSAMFIGSALESSH